MKLKNTSQKSSLRTSANASSTLEYITLLVVIVTVLLAFTGPMGIFHGAFKKSLALSVGEMANMAKAVSPTERDTLEYDLGDDPQIIFEDFAGPESINPGGGGSGSDESRRPGLPGLPEGPSGPRGPGVPEGPSGPGMPEGPSGPDVVSANQPNYDSDIIDALALLEGSDAGSYFYDLIFLRKIDVKYEDFNNLYGLSNNIAGFWYSVTDNTIHLSHLLKNTFPLAAVAAIIAHEATHADYAYNPEKNIASTLARHPDANISIDSTQVQYIYNFDTKQYEAHVVIENSIDQEYVAFSNQMEVWKELKGNQTCWALDSDLARYESDDTGEVLKASLRRREAYAGLPEF